MTAINFKLDYRAQASYVEHEGATWRGYFPFILTIEQRRSYRALYEKAKPVPEEQWTPRDAALDPKPIRRVSQRKTPEVQAEMEAMLRRGCGFKEVANTLNTTYYLVQQRARAIGIADARRPREKPAASRAAGSR